MTREYMQCHQRGRIELLESGAAKAQRECKQSVRQRLPGRPLALLRESSTRNGRR